MQNRIVKLNLSTATFAAIERNLHNPNVSMVVIEAGKDRTRSGNVVSTFNQWYGPELEARDAALPNGDRHYVFTRA